MSILDKKHILTIDLDDSSIEYSKKIFFYNTDKNISNLYVKIKKNNDDGVGVELSANDLKDITIKLTAIKPKTNQTREMTGILTEELTDQSCAIYKFELSQEFTDQVGSVVCEFELSNASGEKVTIDAFSYRIKESKLTGLNAEIESNPDLPVLKQLIKEVKELQTNGGTTGNHTHNNKITLDKITEEKVTSWDNKAEIKHEHSDYLKEHQDLTNYQTKIDKNITAEDKSIVNNINNLNTQFNTTAKDLLLEGGKLYLKRSDGAKLGAGVMLPLSGGGGSVTWENLTGKPSTFTPSSHKHNKSEITDFPKIPTVTNDLTTTLKQNYDNAYAHSQSTHAPANAQKNSDITKEEIETKLTGKISSHSHANCVPTGGTSGQVLAKVDETDYNTNWINPPSSEWVKLGKITLTPEIVSAEWDIPNAKELFLMLKNTNTSTFEAGWLKHHINNGGERGISPAVKIDAGKYMIMSIQNINRNVVTRFNSNISDVFGGGVDQLRTIFTMIDTDYITHYKILPDNVPVLMDVEVYYR